MAGRKPGTPKTGGRKAGTPNKKTQALLDKCEALGFDPWAALCEMAMNEDKLNVNRFAALKEVCSYVYPKRKALEIDMPPADDDVDDLRDEPTGTLVKFLRTNSGAK